MAVNIKSATNIGIDSLIINVEVDITTGIPSFAIIVNIIHTFLRR